MLDLRDLIILRIDQLKQIPTSQTKLLEYFSPGSTIQSQFQLNRAIMKQLSLIKKAEKQRIEKEALLLEQIKGLRFLSTKVIEEVLRDNMQVYYASLDIFTCYDPNTHILCHDSSLSHKLRQLYLRFFEKNQPPFNLEDLFQLLSHHITESTPFILLGWVCEWVRGLFAEEIQNFIGREFSRHEEEMKRINYSRGNSMSAIKEKYANPLSNSTSLPRTQDNMLMLNNKESFYGLITEELTRYYKWLPLDLDLGFIKPLRKFHSKGNEFEKDQNLQKAAEILIDSKNRHIKQQIERYAVECEKYRQKYPNVLTKNVSEPNIKKKQSPSISPHKQSKCQLKKPFSFQKFFDRVKSQSKQDSTANTYSQKRNSLLLCSKNQISFQSSKEIMKKMHKDKVRKQFELPELIANNHMISNNPTSTSKKQASFFGPVNRSIISNYEKINKNVILQPKCYEFKPSSKDRLKDKINTNCLRISQKSRMDIEDNPQTTRRDLQDMRINRKLMLQLLREKNKHAFLDK